MNKVTCQISMSLDAFVAGPNQSFEKPSGDIPENLLHHWMFDEPEKHQAELDALQDGSVLFPKRKSELRMAEASMFRSSARRRPRDNDLAPPSRGFPLPCHPSRGSGRPRTAARKRATMCRDTWLSSKARRAVDSRESRSDHHDKRHAPCQ